jgi:hypothetical protein
MTSSARGVYLNAIRVVSAKSTVGSVTVLLGLPTALYLFDVPALAIAICAAISAIVSCLIGILATYAADRADS